MHGEVDVVNRFHVMLSPTPAKILAKMGMSPNVITLLSLLMFVSAGILILLDKNIWLNITAAFLIQLGLFTDVLDGAVARLTDKSTKLGAWLDPIIDMIGYLFLVACIGIRVYLDSLFLLSL